MAQSLIIPRSEVTHSPGHEHPLPWGTVFWVAAGLTIVGWLDIGLLWAPMRISEIGWRFSVIRATVDSLPLVTIALTAWLLASAHRESRGGLAVVAGISGATCVILLVLGAWFVATGLRMQSPGAPSVPGRLALLRTSLFAVIYVVVYAVITASAVQWLLRHNDGNRPR